MSAKAGQEEGMRIADVVGVNFVQLVDSRRSLEHRDVTSILNRHKRAQQDSSLRP